MILFYLFVVYWISISLLGLSTMKAAFKKYQNYKEVQMKPEWQALVRTDAHKWNKNKILLGCIVLAPIRFLVLLIYLGIFFTIALCIAINGKFSRFFQNILYYQTHLFNYVMKIFVIRIEEQFQSTDIQTPIVICNHVNWFDIFYCVLRFLPLSFISKDQVRQYPLVGTLAKTLNCIFLDRDSNSNRKQAIQKIKQRIIDYSQKQETAFPLMIFPQGTTSNGRGVLKFKMGAFENLSPITAICLNYQCDDCLLGQDEITQAQHLFLMISQFPKLKVKKFIMTPKIGETPEDYKDRAQSEIAKKLGYANTNGRYRDKRQLQEYRLRNNKEKNK